MAESYTPPGSSTAYTVPELTDPADAPQAFRDFADSVQNVADMLTVTDVSADMTLAAGDEGTMLSVDTVAAAADVTLTVPDNATVALPVGFTVAVANLGGGGFKVKLAKGPGVIIQDQGFLQVEDYRITTLVKISTNFWLVQAGSATYTPPSGPQAAVISSPAPTGQYTDGDGTWDYYEFTASGSLTVADAGNGMGGFADVLVVGGGGAGGGGISGNGGGGAGGMLVVPGAYLPAGSLTVVVGAGGSGTATRLGQNGVSSRLDSYYAVGGGGGGVQTANLQTGQTGGSGGGGAANLSGGAGTSGQGNDGAGGGSGGLGDGGGGAGATGSLCTSQIGGAGGNGVANAYTGSSVTYAGGGGGGVYANRTSGGAGGAGGGGGGSKNADGTSGDANTGGGGGGGGGGYGGSAKAGGSGGSGIVVVRVAT